ncbi:MAG: shikimate dehydrogenase [Lachnospiraceae bacterium]|nr:shikimate dehydrogenase [Lachnospiraceae bacterium]
MSDFNIWDKVINDYKSVKADKYLGIFGYPIKHTLSPVIHDTISDEFFLREKYIPFEIDSNLGDYVKTAYESGIVGLNITVPYKEKIIPFLSDIDKDAGKIGAVNTLVRTYNGYKGYNTDMEGLYRSITETGTDIRDREIIMLGAGGAARAVAYMCKKYGAKKVYIINRSVDKAIKLACDMDEDKFIPVSIDEYNSIPKGGYIFIQCTSIGLKEGDGIPLVNDADFYKQATFAVDLIYNPAKTKFLKLMEEYRIPAINGLKMLLYQGIIANELWNGKKIDKILSEKIFLKLNKKLYG